MSKIALQLTHSVEADVSLAFAWQYRTNIATWNDPPATFDLDGPFATGTQGTTLLPGQEPLRWLIRDVRPGESFVIEMPLDRASLTFEWRFQELPGARTKLTQHVVLSGENAAAYTAQVEAGFGANLPDGMRKASAEMETAYSR